MKNNRLILAFLILCFSTIGFSQTGNIKKADKFYLAQSYSEAIPYYERAIKKDSLNPTILSRLGDCYRLTNNSHGQLLCYGKLVKTEKAEPIHKLYYGQALTENGEAEKAKQFFDQYTADSRGKELAASLAKIKNYNQNSDAYTLELALFNSSENDFCAINYNNSTVFVSSRNQTKWINYKHGWTNYQCLQLYSIKKDSTRDGIQNAEKFHLKTLSDSKYKFNNGPVCFSKDNSIIYFTHNAADKKDVSKDGIYKLRIYQASINNGSLDQVTELPFNNKDYNTCHPSLSLDGNMLFFASDREGGFGGLDIYMSKKASNGVWGEPVNLGSKVNTAGNELFPFITSKDLLYFSSNGHDGMGGLDVYETRIKDGKAGRVYNMGIPVNSKNDDFGLYLSENNKTGYISSNRKNGGLDDDVYHFNVLREVKRGKEIILITKDKETGAILANTKILMNGETVITNEKGEFSTTIEEDINYKLKVERDDYYKLEDSVSTKFSPEETFTKTLILEKDLKLSLLAFVTDVKTNQALEGVKITIKELPSNSAFDTYTTLATGDYRKPLTGKKLGDKISYSIMLEKEKYLTKTVTFIYDIKKPGEININESVDLKLGKVEVGMDLSKMIDMKPIYFDLGKAVIRKDAAVELDKIVKIMNEYPNMYIELGSHTDCRGNAKANTVLSTKRAKASAAYIMKSGIDKSRIIGKGYGELKLINGCACEGKVKPTCSEEEHSKNRRTEFLITKLK